MTPAEFIAAVIADMQGPDQGQQYGYDRGYYAHSQMGQSARGISTPTYWVPTGPYASWIKGPAWWSALSPWWVAFNLVGNTATVNQIEIGRIVTIGRLNGTNNWQTLASTSAGWAKMVDKSTGIDTGAVTSWAGSVPGYPSMVYQYDRGPTGTDAIHGGAGIFPITPQNYDAFIHCIAARVVGPQAAQCRFGVWAGYDWYPDINYRFGQNGNGPVWGPGASTSRIHLLTPQWQFIATVAINPPGRAGQDANFTDGGVGLYANIASLTANPPPVPAGLLPTTGAATNQAPIVNAGADRSITLPNTAALAGTVTDDGLPVGASVTYAWTKDSGPGVVTFSNSTILNPIATFGSSGTFVLRLTATDGALSAADTLTVNVAPASAPTNQTPAEFIAEVISDMQSTNAGVVKGFQFDRYADVKMGMAARGDQTPTWWVPTGPYASWVKGPTPWTATSPEWWAFPLSGNTATDVSIEIGRMITIGRLTGTNTWAVIVNVGGGIATLNDADGGYISDITPTAGTVPAYTSNIYAWTPGAGGDNRIHGFSGVSAIDPQLYDSIIHCVAMRLVGPNADIAQFALWSALYWYPDVDYVIGQDGNGPTFLPYACASRLKLITDDWSYTACAPINPPGRGADAPSYPLGDSSGVYANLATMVSNPPSQPVGLLPTDQAPNLAPVVNAGADQTITLPSAATLAGTVTDDGLPGTGLIRTWGKISGPGTVAFSDSGALNPFVNFGSDGVYVLGLTANDGELITTDTVTITVNAAPPPTPPVNQAPAVTAGADKTLVITDQGIASITLNGIVTDDGLPAAPSGWGRAWGRSWGGVPGGVLTALWTKDSGPGVVTFTNSAAAVTEATFSAPGTYVLRLTANDSALSTYDTVTIKVNPPPYVPVEEPPVAPFDYLSLITQEHK